LQVPRRLLTWPRPPKLTKTEAIGVGIVIWQATEFVRVTLDSLMHGLAFMTFYPALVLVAYIAGVEGGLAVLIGALTVGWFTWLRPFASHPGMLDTLIISAVFAVAGAMVVLTVAGLRQAVLDLDERDENARVINRELVHRLRNAFTIVATLTSQAFQRAGVDPEIAGAVTARIRALARAEELVRLDEDMGSPLDLLVERVLVPVAPDPSRLSTQGDEIRIPKETVSRLALVLHELGTNALKYGAWSNHTGRVMLRWQANAPGVCITWQEQGGPAVAPSGRRGLGSALVEHAIPGARVEREFGPAGLQVTLHLPPEGREREADAAEAAGKV
jgi:two-component sensor histidine kinase